MAGVGEGGRGGSNYDVSISFRGPDTRQGFVDFLYEHMTLCGIRVFVDKDRIRVGEEIEEEIMDAICDSKICMPVFSKGYASTKWCLLELEEFMKGRVGQDVMPVFYDVTPDDVELKTRMYSKPLTNLQKKHGKEKVDRWRKCLKDACKRQGWNLAEYTGQGKLISKITQEVLFNTRKRNMSLSNPIVGIEGPVKEIKELLDGHIDRVRFVIIHGKGGIGKTTLAKVIFNEVSPEFQGCSFLENVRESSRGSVITKLQQQIMDDIFRMSVNIHNVDYGMNEIRGRNKKVLLVLDDVDDSDQIQKLAGMFNWFGRGSRIIVTTRDSNVIPNELSMDMKEKMQNIEGEEDLGDICFYKMRAMDRQHATTLFKRHAFGADEYSFDDDDLLQEIVLLAYGLPLALAVVGSHLSGQTKEVWTETLAMLKKAPHGKVRSVLMISYESLEDNEKELFLDIACHFRGRSKRLPTLFWESVNLHPVNGLKTLLHKNLIEIDDKGIIWMHDQLRDLGREVVSRDGKHTRIWEQEEGLHMVLDEKGTSDVVSLYMGELSTSYKFKKDGFEKLVNLRALRLGKGSFTGDFGSCFRQLRWFSWSSFPSKFEAQNFSLPNLIILQIKNTDVDENWTGWKGLLGSNLKALYLYRCCGLTSTPNFSTCLGLEELFLGYCDKLTEIDGSIGKLDWLTHLTIIGSASLKGLPPEMASLKRMEKLFVNGITNTNFQEEFHVSVRFDNLKMLCHLAIESLGLRRMPEGIGQLKLLKYLSFEGCGNMTSLPESLWELESLVELKLRRTGIVDLSGRIGNMKELKVLDISWTEIEMLPRDICSLTKLEESNVSYCWHMEQLPSEIESLPSLRILDLQGTSIAVLPSTIDRLSNLRRLNMEYCQMLQRVGKLPASLSDLRLPYFSLEDIPDLSNLVNLCILSLRCNEASFFSEDFQQTNDGQVKANQKARTIFWDISWVDGLHLLKRLVIEVPVDIFNRLKFDFKSFPSAELVISCSDAESFSQLPQNLSTLVLANFRAEFLHFSPYENLKNLSVLKIERLLTEEIDLGGFESLENLHAIYLLGCESLMRLSISSSPPKLVFLEILGCSKLVNISGLDRMESLHELVIFICGSLQRLPDLSNLLKIKDIIIVKCDSMESMPALPSTEHPIDLFISDCRMLPNFVGPHNLYQGVKMVGNIKGFMKWILKIVLYYCMRPLRCFPLCNGSIGS